MDKAIFIGMTGAKSSMRQLEIVTNNLANSNTVGFKADYEIMQQKPVNEDGMQSRVYSSLDQVYTNFEKGPIINTGSDLDLAIVDEGFIAVQSKKTGKEGYTRSGGLEITPDGYLITKSGQKVLGDGGLINIPPAEKVSIAADGTVSALLLGATGQKQLVNIDRIKLTKPNVEDLQKGADGLFYLPDGGTAPLDITVRVRNGELEGSNVNTIETLTKLVDLSRSFEVHTNLMKTMQDNSDKSNQLLQLK